MDETTKKRILEEVAEGIDGTKYGKIEVVLNENASFVDVVSEKRIRIPRDVTKSNDRHRRG